MNLLADLDPGEAAIRTVLSALAQGSVVILLAALLARSRLRHRAEARHTLWLAALVWVLLSPAVSTLAERAGLGLWTLPIPVPGRTESGDGDEIAPVGRAADGLAPRDPRPDLQRPDGRVVADTTLPPAPTTEDAAHQAPPSPVRSGRPLVGGVVLIWMQGTLVGLARIVLMWARLRTFARDLRPLNPERHGETLVRVRETLGRGSLPPIMSSPGVSEPFVIGLLGPRVVLPEGLAEAVTSDALHQILVHECAHVVRRDLLVGLLQRVAGAFYWPHPLVHFLNRQLARAREEVCDNHVLQACDRFSYARTLLALTETCRPGRRLRPGLGLLTARWTLAARVAGLLDSRRVPMTRTSSRMRMTVAVAIAGTGLCAASVRFDGARAEETANRADAPGTASAAVTSPEVWSIGGKVVDEQGRPVAGSLVQSWPESLAQGGQLTGADGRFTLPMGGKRLFALGLVAQKESGDRIGLVRFEDEPLQPGRMTPVAIILKPSRAVVVRVVDDAGRPVGGAAVEAIAHSFRAQAITGANGIAVVRIAADAQVRWVIGFKGGIGFDYYENDRSTATGVPPLKQGLTLTLDGARTVRIKAVDSQDKPVAGVVIHPHRLLKTGKLRGADVAWGLMARSTTDARGLATFDWLAKDSGVIEFRLESGEYIGTHPLVDQPGGPAELTARLARLAHVRGRVSFADGKPARGILVRVQNNSEAPTNPGEIRRLAARTGDDGTYSLDVAPDRPYLVAVHDEDWTAPIRTNIVVQEGRTQHGVDFTLGRKPPVRGTSARRTEAVRHEVKDQADVVQDSNKVASPRVAAIHGTVFEKTPTGDRPVAGAVIFRLKVGRSGTYTPSVADDAGRFRFLAAPGDWILYAYRRDGTLAGFMPVAAGAGEVRMVVSRATRLTGRVVDAGGKPQARRPVGVSLDTGPEFASSGHLGLRVRADDQGRFTFPGVPVGSQGEVSVFHGKEPTSTTPRTVVKWEAPDLDPVAIPDLIVPAEQPAR